MHKIYVNSERMRERLTSFYVKKPASNGTLLFNLNLFSIVKSPSLRLYESDMWGHSLIHRIT